MPVFPAPTAVIPCYNDYLQTVGPLAFNVPTLETGLFVQDDWRVLPRLTLNLGLRWDHESLPSPVLPNPALPQTTTFPTDNKDFGPRFGFAWDITGQGTTVIRGGYGLYFGRITNEQIYDAMTQTGNPGSQLSPDDFPDHFIGRADCGSAELSERSAQLQRQRGTGEHHVLPLGYAPAGGGRIRCGAGA